MNHLRFADNTALYIYLFWLADWNNCRQYLPAIYGTHLCTLNLGNEALVLQLKPVGFVQLRTDEEVEVTDLVIFSNQRGSQAELCVGLDWWKHTPKHLGGNVLNLCSSKHHWWSSHTFCLSNAHWIDHLITFVIVCVWLLTGHTNL